MLTMSSVAVPNYCLKESEMIVHTHITQHTNLQNCILKDVVSTPICYTSTHYLYQRKVLKVVTGISVHWTYSSSCSSAISPYCWVCQRQSRTSISSVVELTRFLVNHGGLLDRQHVPPPSQTWPSQSVAFG